MVEPAPASGVAAASSEPVRRRHPFTEAQAASAALDELIAELSRGIRSQGHYDDLADRARGICRRLDGAFRGPARTYAPCLARTAHGAWF